VWLLGRKSVHGAASENFFLLTVLAVTDRHPAQARIRAGFIMHRTIVLLSTGIRHIS
jgi:hypothetical protein